MQLSNDLERIAAEWIAAGSMDAGELAGNIVEYFEAIERRPASEKQRDGIMAAQSRGVKFGRPRMTVDQRLAQTVARWRAGEMSAIEAYRTLGMSKNTFYRRVKELPE